MVRPSDNKCFASEFKLWVMELSDIHRSMFYPLSRAKLLPQVTCFFFYFCFTCFLIILSIPRKIPRKRTNINLEITIHRTYIRGDRTWRSAIARFEIVCWIWSRRTKIPNVHTFFHFGNLLETRFVDFHLKILGQQYAEINELENILHEIPFPRRKEYK